MNEKDFHLKLSSLNAKSVSASNEKLIISSVLSYKPDSKVLQWKGKKTLDDIKIKKEASTVSNGGLKEKKKSSLLKKNTTTNRRNASNKTKVQAHSNQTRTTQLMSANRREDGLLNKTKNPISNKKSLKDQKQKMSVDYNEIKKLTKMGSLKKTVVEKMNLTKITNNKKRRKMKGKEQLPVIMKKGNRKRNNEKNMQAIKENKNINSSKYDKNSVHNKKKNAEKKDITIQRPVKNKIPNDEIKKLSNIPKLHIANIKNNGNGSVTNEGIEKASYNSSSTHFMNSDENVKKCYHRNNNSNNNNNNSNDRIIIDASFYKNNTLLSIPVVDNKEIQETYEEISQVLDSEEEIEEEVQIPNGDRNNNKNKKVTKKKSIIKEVEETDNKKLEEYCIIHNQGSKSVNSVKEPNFFNSLIFTNEFRLKMCYSNNFIDLKKIYFEKFLEEENNTSQAKADSSLFKNNDSLNSSELFSISLDTEKTKTNETEIKRNNVKCKQLLEEPLPSHQPIKIVESLNISEPFIHSYLLKGFNDSLHKDKRISIHNSIICKKEDIFDSRMDEHHLITDEIKVLQDKEMEALSKLIQQNGIYNESFTQDTSSLECFERRSTSGDSSVSFIIESEFQNEKKFSYDILLLNSMKEKDRTNFSETHKGEGEGEGEKEGEEDGEGEEEEEDGEGEEEEEEEEGEKEGEEESPAIDDFIRIDLTHMHKHYKDSEIKMHTQQQVEANEHNRTRTQMETKKHTQVTETKDICTSDNTKETMNISELIKFHKCQQEIGLLDLSSIINNEQNQIEQKRKSPLAVDKKKERSRSLMDSKKSLHFPSTQQVITEWGKREEDEKENKNEEGTWNDRDMEEILKKEIVNSELKLKIGATKKKKQNKKKMNESSPKSVQEKSFACVNKNLIEEKHKKEQKEKGYIIKTKSKVSLPVIKNDIRGYHKRNSLLRRKILKNKIGTKVIIKNRQEEKENNEEENRMVQENLTKQSVLYNKIKKGKKHSLYRKLNKYKKKKRNVKKNAHAVPKKTRKGKNEITKSKMKRKKNKVLKNGHSITDINDSIHHINYDSSFFYGNPNIIYENCESLEYMMEMMKHNIEFVMNIHKKTEINKINSDNIHNKTMERSVGKFLQLKMNNPMIYMKNLNAQGPIDTISNKLYNTSTVLSKEECSTIYENHKKEMKKEDKYKKNGKEMDSSMIPFQQNNNRNKTISEVVKKNKKEHLSREQSAPTMWNHECLLKKTASELHKESFQKNRRMKSVSKTNELKLWSCHLSDTSTCDEELINRGWNKVETEKKTKDNILVDSERCVNTMRNNESIQDVKLKLEQEVTGLKYKEVKEKKEREKIVPTEVRRNSTTYNYNKKKEEEFHILNESWIETCENRSGQFALDLGKYVMNHRIIDLNVNKRIDQEMNDKKNETVLLMNIDSRDNVLLKTVSMKNSQRDLTKINKETNGNHGKHKNKNHWLDQLNENTVVRKAKLKKAQGLVEEKKKSVRRRTPLSIQNFFKQILNKTHSYPINKSKEYLENLNSRTEHKNNIRRNGYIISTKNANASKLGFTRSLIPMKTSLHNKNSMVGFSDILSKVQNNKQIDNSKKEVFRTYQGHFNQLSSILNTTKVYKKQKEPQPKLKRNKSMFVGKSFECLRKRNEEESKKRKIKNYNLDKTQNFNKTDMFYVKKDRISFFEKIKNFKLFKF